MKRMQFSIALLLVCAAPAFAWQDTSSSVDRQANETYSKNSVPPVPAANLGDNLPADTGRPDIDASADQQARETYERNAQPTVPSASYDRTHPALINNGARPIGYHRHHHHRTRHHRRIHRGHVAGNLPVIDHDADRAIVTLASTPTTIPPRN